MDEREAQAAKERSEADYRMTTLEKKFQELDEREAFLTEFYSPDKNSTVLPRHKRHRYIDTLGDDVFGHKEIYSFEGDLLYREQKIQMGSKPALTLRHGFFTSPFSPNELFKPPHQNFIEKKPKHKHGRRRRRHHHHHHNPSNADKRSTGAGSVRSHDNRSGEGRQSNSRAESRDEPINEFSGSSDYSYYSYYSYSYDSYDGGDDTLPTHPSESGGSMRTSQSHRSRDSRSRGDDVISDAGSDASFSSSASLFRVPSRGKIKPMGNLTNENTPSPKGQSANVRFASPSSPVGSDHSTPLRGDTPTRTNKLAPLDMSKAQSPTTPTNEGDTKRGRSSRMTARMEDLARAKITPSEQTPRSSVRARREEQRRIEAAKRPFLEDPLGTNYVPERLLAEMTDVLNEPTETLFKSRDVEGKDWMQSNEAWRKKLFKVKVLRRVQRLSDKQDNDDSHLSAMEADRQREREEEEGRVVVMQSKLASVLNNISTTVADSIDSEVKHRTDKLRATFLERMTEPTPPPYAQSELFSPSLQEKIFKAAAKDKDRMTALRQRSRAGSEVGAPAIDKFRASMGIDTRGGGGLNFNTSSPTTSPHTDKTARLRLGADSVVARVGMRDARQRRRNMSLNPAVADVIGRFGAGGGGAGGATSSSLLKKMGGSLGTLDTLEESGGSDSPTTPTTTTTTTTTTTNTNPSSLHSPTHSPPTVARGSPRSPGGSRVGQNVAMARFIEQAQQQGDTRAESLPSVTLASSVDRSRLISQIHGIEHDEGGVPIRNRRSKSAVAFDMAVFEASIKHAGANASGGGLTPTGSAREGVGGADFGGGADFADGSESSDDHHNIIEASAPTPDGIRVEIVSPYKLTGEEIAYAGLETEVSKMVAADAAVGSGSLASNHSLGSASEFARHAEKPGTGEGGRVQTVVMHPVNDAPDGDAHTPAFYAFHVYLHTPIDISQWVFNVTVRDLSENPPKTRVFERLRVTEDKQLNFNPGARTPAFAPVGELYWVSYPYGLYGHRLEMVVTCVRPEQELCRAYIHYGKDAGVAESDSTALADRLAVSRAKSQRVSLDPYANERKKARKSGKKLLSFNGSIQSISAIIAINNSMLNRDSSGRKKKVRRKKKGVHLKAAADPVNQSVPAMATHARLLGSQPMSKSFAYPLQQPLSPTSESVDESIDDGGAAAPSSLARHASGRFSRQASEVFGAELEFSDSVSVSEHASGNGDDVSTGSVGY